MDVQQLAHAISEAAPCCTLNAEEVQGIASAGHVIEVGPGETILQQGEPGNCLLIVLDGEAEITAQDHQGKIHPVGFLHGGQLVGEVGVFKEAPRMATVKATRSSRLFRLERDAFEALLREGNTGAYKMSVVMARSIVDRVHFLYDKVMELLDLGAPAMRNAELQSFRKKILSELDF
ncbi:MAG: cyclic nucleotide-binding domain-containing protein [Planctomycetota bacterium]|jgi:NTE family protein